MSLKSILLVVFVYILVVSSNAQSTVMKTTNLTLPKPVLLGGGLVIGGGSGFFQMGLNPELLKSYTSYLDMGLAMNLYFESYNANEYNPIRSRSFRYGIGTFVRAWPMETFFVQIQPEYNWTNYSRKDTELGTSGSRNYGVGSVLAGVGYGRHSEHGMTYMSIMIDLMNDINSPYRNSLNRAQPIFRAGIGFPIRSKKSSH